MMFLLPSLLSSLLVLSQSSAGDINQRENTTLLLVQAVLRHGERAPLFLYENDPNEPELWPGGLAKLTRFGKKHHYAIGKLLRSMYKDFLTTDPKEVCVNSSSTDRCLRGAAVTAAALYEPEGIWKFEDDLNWQPIPVYYLPEDEDKYLSADSSCPLGLEEIERMRHSEEILELTRKHQKMLEDVSNYTGMDISQEFSALILYDTLFIEKMYNLTIPTLLDNYFEELQEFREVLFKVLYGSDLLLRLRYGSLLGEISGSMRRKINGDIPDLKFQLSCVHDVHIAALLKVFNFTNMPQPPYCAMLLFELHQMADDTMAGRLLYLNSTGPLIDIGEPHVLFLDDCTEFCPLENFTSKFRHLIPDDWEKECQLNTASSNYSKSITLLILVSVIIVAVYFFSLIGICYYSKKKIKEQEEKYLSGFTFGIENIMTTQ
ncbi:unnamed protein product [Larinioides sclopetarius]|uniref:acid phosphatase n=1 Tax=Larinioides sclopetarius TaxID=280406 RepID=A0AAV2ACE6_9ARAC